MRRLAAVPVLAALIALAGARPAAAQAASCDALGQTTFVRDVLDEIYLWYQELPPLDPALFDTPEAYLDAVRYRPLDATFSYVADRAASDAFFSDSQFIGFGFSSQITGPEQARVAAVFPQSPAEEAGLQRGDRLLAIDGRAVSELVAEGTLFGSFGPNEIGYEVHLAWTAEGGTVREATLVKRLVTIPTVSLTRVFELDGRRVGYVHFRNFVRPSTEALDAAFGALRDAGADELVLDLRYNGGGLVTVAQHLAGLVGGTVTFAQVFGRYEHNDRNRSRDTTLRFPRPDATLELRRLMVITTGSSASASELVINGLRPWMEVVVIGTPTFGKPVGQYAFNFCDKVLFPVSFSIVNARGEADYFGGIPADCAAGDDLDHPLGDPAEASLGEALHYLRHGSCSSTGSVSASARAPRRETDGWRALLGAH
jgi:C-terminal processing protease CtpA/Prc